MNSDIPAKANRVFNIIILCLILIGIRVWILGVTQREEYVKEARKPARKTLIEPPERATIRDRFNVPLAVNRIQYNAAISYREIRQIPLIKWEKNDAGKRVKFLLRKNYIGSLCALLGEELKMDPQEIEDIIYAKASLFPGVPFPIKENITEKEYYRLRMLEKDWRGIAAEKRSCRFYPQGKAASSLIGFLGAIPRDRYLTIAHQIEELESYLEKRDQGELIPLPRGFENTKEVRRRLGELQEKAYTINDKVGKAGVERSFDEQLRGYFGKKMVEVDMRGNLIRELPGSSKPAPGERHLLAISSELQQFAESLLAEYEEKAPDHSLGDPWIKGGAIVAMLPSTGEILSLASYPRFDPNDFVQSKQKGSELNRWLETENHIAEMWDGKRPLEKECYSSQKNQFYEETLPLSWENYLSLILSKESEVRASLEKMGTVRNALHFQEVLFQIMDLVQVREMDKVIDLLYGKGAKEDPVFLPLKKKIDPYLSSLSFHRDKLLFIDLCRLLAPLELFPPELIADIGNETLSSYRSLTQSVISLQSTVREEIRKLYRQNDFKKWRELYFKEYLKEKREEEKAGNRYQRPYTDYLVAAEKKLFADFWNEFRLVFLETMILGACPPLFEEAGELKPYLSYLLGWHEESRERILPLRARFSDLPSSSISSLLKTFRSFEELTIPLVGHYRLNKKGQLGKDLAGAFYPQYGFGYTKSQAFQQSAPQGSLFKVITAYEAMKQRWDLFQERGESLNPLVLKDDMHLSCSRGKDLLLGYFQNGDPIYRHYKGGRLPRAHPNIGTVDLVGALEGSSNIYFSILAGDSLEEPQDLVDAARLFGLGEKTGVDLPGEFAGCLPQDVDVNRSGLYLFAIGQHSLVVTPLQTAVLFSALANQGHLLKPEVIHLTAGKEHTFQDPFFSTEYPYRQYLSSVAIDFPFFTEPLADPLEPVCSEKKQEIKRQLFLPKEMRELLFEGMKKTVSGARGTARLGRLRHLFKTEEHYRQSLAIRDSVIGKTGTAEILHHPFLDATSSPVIRNHVWFGAISFKDSSSWEHPELVVVVYLRFGDAGKIGAPLALRMIHKWREICSRKES